MHIESLIPSERQHHWGNSAKRIERWHSFGKSSSYERLVRPEKRQNIWNKDTKLRRRAPGCDPGGLGRNRRMHLSAVGESMDPSLYSPSNRLVRILKEWPRDIEAPQIVRMLFAGFHYIEAGENGDHCLDMMEIPPPGSRCHRKHISFQHSVRPAEKSRLRTSIGPHIQGRAILNGGTLSRMVSVRHTKMG